MKKPVALTNRLWSPGDHGSSRRDLVRGEQLTTSPGVSGSRIGAIGLIIWPYHDHLDFRSAA